MSVPSLLSVHTRWPMVRVECLCVGNRMCQQTNWQFIRRTDQAPDKKHIGTSHFRPHVWLVQPWDSIIFKQHWARHHWEGKQITHREFCGFPVCYVRTYGLYHYHHGWQMQLRHIIITIVMTLLIDCLGCHFILTGRPFICYHLLVWGQDKYKESPSILANFRYYWIIYRGPFVSPWLANQASSSWHA